MSELKFTVEQIVWQEVPGEVSLAFLFSGCPLRCEGCHSADTWKADIGTELTADYLQGRLKRYRGLISCVLFMGGEWQPEALKKRLDEVRAAGLKTCLYTGLERSELESVSDGLIPRLDYVKTGRWHAALGGLDNPASNQRFVNLHTGEVLNRLFIRQVPAAAAGGTAK
ncbi:anaerobic ribonucleoside-triphosphate reductase activating protein [Neisseria animalis]|uniref:Anaerobic ribonucleoside-triphosphate reductase activating protein n=1 Tax=Neisseria animalis TaxID=492 RepID=A0A5P3MTS8_NEIAN|nr:anaerobic ribonucleoside-triphosphate reductase activating protein [Neisseria animalis]QEY24455.1 anaerobic ribonucleoside-triphosphate reductase activating protein [Neisseria animalis]ROW31929.1 anaerobic ribonucleoside-triphosphate reductase activating protein [Neisseria animalis]VEE07102.1 Pyruvate formate-lyase 1-activating enzyme [Neisseria animalis]